MIDLQIVGVLVVALYNKGDGVGPQVIIVVGCRSAFAPEPRQDYATATQTYTVGGCRPLLRRWLPHCACRCSTGGRPGKSLALMCSTEIAVVEQRIAERD